MGHAFNGMLEDNFSRKEHGGNHNTYSITDGRSGRLAIGVGINAWHLVFIVANGIIEDGS